MKNNINSYLHKFSKAVVAEGQLYQSQAQVKSGHNVDFVSVRGEDVPECMAKQILLTSKNTVIAKYAGILKYWNNFQLTEYPKSNGQSFYLIDDEGNAISDFIDPSDKLINGRQLSRGYTAQIFGYRQSSEIPEKISPIHYEFQSYSGILSFKQGFTPKDLGYDKISISAFSYIGKNVKQNFRDVDELIAMNLMLMQKLNSERIVVQPYTFTTANMTTVWDNAKPIPGAFNRFGKQMWCQRFRIVIPGYVFEVSSFNMLNDNNDLAIYENGVIIPDMIHTEDGNTIIEVELEINAGDNIEDTGDGKVVIGYKESLDVITGKPKLSLITGDLKFTASTFKRNDGQKLDIKLPIELQGIGTNLTPITPQIKKQLLVDQYVVEFTPTSVDTMTTELFDKLYQKK